MLALTFKSRKHRHLIHARRSATLIFSIALFASVSSAQSPQPSNPQPAQKPDRVTTTVVVHGEVKDDYLSDPRTAASLDDTPIKDLPISVTSITSAVIGDQISRTLSDVIKNDASVGEDYAPVGYYGDFQIRGFPLDLATGLQINGLTIAGEQDVPLENKQRVEIIKGIAGLETGVASSGGVINYATKLPYRGLRPTIDLATDHRGSSYGSTQFLMPGLRDSLLITAAAEDMRTYVEHADGWRGMGAADGRWQLGSATELTTNFEYQHKVQRSEAGYQLLGGSTVPSPVFPSTMLGFQTWSKPNTFDTLNAGARLQHNFAPDWTLRIGGSYSHSLIDDNVIYPYGPALDAEGNSLCPDSPYYFFCPDGSYEIYDYRSPNELRIDSTGEALLVGHFKTGSVGHDVVGGGSLFHRSVDLAKQIVYEPLGIENLYQPNISYEPDGLEADDSQQLADFNHQASAIVQERAHLPRNIVLQAGGRFVRVTDFNYSSARTLWLPQYAATWTPIPSLTLYSNYGTLLSLGPQAPWWVDNSALFLTPFMTRQSEIGAKYDHGVLITADYFRMRQPFFYPRVIQSADSFCDSNLLYGVDVAPGDLCFESAGHETHDGFEFNAQGKAAAWMQLSASAATIRAISTDTGTPAYDNKQVINVPRFHSALFADILVPHGRGFHLMPGWSYTSSKQATRDESVSVGGYNLFNLGARYTPGGEAGHLTFHFYADNILNKRYWKDTGASLGDTFIHQGAPTTVRLSAHYNF
ncbi:MAG: TonB-dependent receptor [Acidobacteria bacterium]|nr:TonB-dependent receptor [Acidobacteriota bacterium]